MSDQMPDEVWIDETEVWVPHACDGTRYIRADLYEQAEAERDALRQQAEGWAQEARTQRATVHECYRACTRATGEPGDWHGAKPVRAVVAERDRLRAALEEIHAYAHECSTGPAVPDHMWHIRGLAQEALRDD